MHERKKDSKLTYKKRNEEQIEDDTDEDQLDSEC